MAFARREGENAPSSSPMEPSLSLHGQRALVTGGSRGIGLAFARTLARAGCDVVINHFDDEAKARSEAQALARESGTKIHPLAADVGDPVAARAMVRAAGEQLGGLDILVSNAGICAFAPFLEL
ncbi:MAG TPA: SDR family NAD(P)-dependent oxidoreductase, partial [Lacunisphaera sp.]|nr:SDR family NAD(P)-dependent oxidoreductase [Lacunisphaera sp.]